MIVGTFSQIGSHFADAIVRLSTNDAALQSLDMSADAVTWQRSGAGPELPVPPELYVSSDGQDYAHVGTMQRVSGGWSYPGFNPPFGLYSLRVIGAVPSGSGSTSEGQVVSTAQFYENDRVFADGFE